MKVSLSVLRQTLQVALQTPQETSSLPVQVLVALWHRRHAQRRRRRPAPSQPRKQRAVPHEAAKHLLPLLPAIGFIFDGTVAARLTASGTLEAKDGAKGGGGGGGDGGSGGGGSGGTPSAAGRRDPKEGGGSKDGKDGRGQDAAARMESSLEDQMRRLLNSSKQLARCSSGTSPLFALSREGFVHVQRQLPLPLPPTSAPISPDNSFDFFLQLITPAAPPAQQQQLATATADANGAPSEEEQTDSLQRWLGVTSGVAGGGGLTSAHRSVVGERALRKFVSKLCDGAAGIGADGMLTAAPPNGPQARPLPTGAQWSAACRQLRDRLFGTWREACGNQTLGPPPPAAGVRPASNAAGRRAGGRACGQAGGQAGRQLERGRCRAGPNASSSTLVACTPLAFTLTCPDR
jgi:hypothetical protein